MLEHEVWLGENVTLARSIRIATGAVFGAGPIVTKDVPPYAVVARNPGRLVKLRFTAYPAIRRPA